MNLQAPRVGVKKENKVSLAQVIGQLVEPYHHPESHETLLDLIALASYDETSLSIIQTRKAVKLFTKILKDVEAYSRMTLTMSQHSAMKQFIRIAKITKAKLAILEQSDYVLVPVTHNGSESSPEFYRAMSLDGLLMKTFRADNIVFAALAFGA